MRAERARHHLLEAQRQRAVDGSAFDRLPREKERGRSGRAIVVDVADRNAGHADAVKRLLAGRGIAIDVAHIGLLHIRVRDAGVGERIDGGGGPHDVVGVARAGLGERDHADSCHENLLLHTAHFTGSRNAFPAGTR